MSLIKDARTYDTAIEIIPQDVVFQGLGYLNHELLNVMANVPGPWVKMPVKRGGVYTCENSTVGIPESELPNVPIRMTHTGPGNRYQPKARCIEVPDLSKIFLPDEVTANIALFDGIMETVGTLIGVEETLNILLKKYNKEHRSKYRPPVIHNFVLVDKSSDGKKIRNLHRALIASPKIWYHGAGADDKSMTGEERGRNKPAIWGRLPDNFNSEIPVAPYYSSNIFTYT